METMSYIFAVFLLWFIVVVMLHTTMTPEQIKASGDFFKKVLVFIDITKILNLFGRNSSGKKENDP